MPSARRDRHSLATAGGGAAPSGPSVPPVLRRPAVIARRGREPTRHGRQGPPSPITAGGQPMRQAHTVPSARHRPHPISDGWGGGRAWRCRCVPRVARRGQGDRARPAWSAQRSSPPGGLGLRRAAPWARLVTSTGSRLRPASQGRPGGWKLAFNLKYYSAAGSGLKLPEVTNCCLNPSPSRSRARPGQRA